MAKKTKTPPVFDGEAKVFTDGQEVKSESELKKAIKEKAKNSKKTTEKAREFPLVTVKKETALILFRDGYSQSDSETRIGVGRGNISKWKTNDPQFKKYWDEIEWEIQEEIRGNSVNIARAFHGMIEAVALGNYHPDHHPQMVRLAFDYLKQTGRFPKTEEQEGEDRKIEQLVQGLATSLVEKFGPEMSI